MSEREPRRLVVWVDNGSEGWSPRSCTTETLIETISGCYAGRFVVTDPPLDTVPYGPVTLPIPAGFGAKGELGNLIGRLR